MNRDEHRSFSFMLPEMRRSDDQIAFNTGGVKSLESIRETERYYI